MSLPRPCLTCGRLSSGPRCPTHRAAANRTRDAHRPTPTQRGYDTAWQRLARAAIAAEPWCHTRGGKCPYPDAGTPSNPLTGDHIVPLARGGTSYDTNVTVLCHRCNSAKRDR